MTTQDILSFEVFFVVVVVVFLDNLDSLLFCPLESRV
jgi:hypothetical protein